MLIPLPKQKVLECYLLTLLVFLEFSLERLPTPMTLHPVSQISSSSMHLRHCHWHLVTWALLGIMGILVIIGFRTFRVHRLVVPVQKVPRGGCLVRSCAGIIRWDLSIRSLVPTWCSKIIPGLWVSLGPHLHPLYIFVKNTLFTVCKKISLPY